MRYQLTRRVTTKEAPWLDRSFEKDEVVHSYDGVTYGAARTGVACSIDGGIPFFELPTDALRELPKIRLAFISIISLPVFLVVFGATAYLGNLILPDQASYPFFFGLISGIVALSRLWLRPARPLKQSLDGSNAQPEWNPERTSVGDALSSVWEAGDSDSSERACIKLLCAVGNNHARTYYPTVVAVAPLLDDILCVGRPWSVRTVLFALMDLLESYEPARGYEIFNDLAGNSQMLANAFKESMCRLRPSVEHIAVGGDVNAELAKGVIDLFDRQ